MVRRFLSSLAILTDPHIVSDGTDDVTITRSIIRERIRFVLVFFSFMCEFALSIIYIDLFAQKKLAVAFQTNELSLFLIYFVLIGCGLRAILLNEISQQTEVIIAHIFLVKIFVLFSIFSYLISFFVSSFFINQPISLRELLLLAITSWTGLAFSLIACVIIILH